MGTQIKKGNKLSQILSLYFIFLEKTPVMTKHITNNNRANAQESQKYSFLQKNILDEDL